MTVVSKGGGVTDRQTDKGKLQLYIVTLDYVGKGA